MRTVVSAITLIPLASACGDSFNPTAPATNAAPASTAAPRTTQALSSASEALENQRERITFTLDEGGRLYPGVFLFVNNLSVGYGQNLSSVLSNSFSGVYLSMATVMCVRSNTGALKC